MTCNLVFAPLHSTMGALLIGVLISGALWGISAIQTYFYFSVWESSALPLSLLRPSSSKTFRHQDTLQLKLLVVFISILDTAHQIMLSHSIYMYLVSGFGDVKYLGVVTWSMITMVLLSALIAVTIQLFMCWRIWILSKNNVYWIVPIVAIVLASFAITIVYFEKCWSLRTWSELESLSKISRAVNGLNFGGDIAISFAMVYLLRNFKPGIESTDALINRLMGFCLKTGLLTTVCAILSLISISVWPNTFIYITFYCVLARLYTNSFLSTLNAREQLRKFSRPAGSSLPSNNDIQWARDLGISSDHTETLDYSNSGTNPISIKQKVETYVHSDIEMNSHGKDNVFTLY
ncbi:hypothetical protein GGU10DRAFT_433084 [Lentinula aff. detonsa]|uniref:DUF6534 domain-containing protein n=1 Tax=Lentinula aff. detonsa TaxID=2804958 RepID=A0AA38KB86_9AGAR|nr:hypothetical protein GGU10DRAFT_433084 [Lentinula aff. detonsa]